MSSRGILEGAWPLRLDKPGIKTQGYYLISCVILDDDVSTLPTL